MSALGKLTRLIASDTFPITQESAFYLAIFEVETIEIPGDERSRKNPGHGYPAHTRKVHNTRLYVTESEELMHEVVAELLDARPGRKDFVVISGKQMQVASKRVVDFG